MDESLRNAARKGNVSDLYTLIQRNGNVLRRLDEVEFIDTPLHIAASEGCMRFAMEMFNLKPSFARKLNQQGLSPLHLAVEKGHKEMALRLLEIDTDLTRVKGKNGETPLHYISKDGDHDGLLDRFLEACPESILDVTTQNRTALHIAVENERHDVLRILTGMLMKKDYRREVVNWKDEDGNTALHLAASKNQPQMLQLLLNCMADKHATNQAGLTALDVAQQHNNKGCITILLGCLIPLVSNIKYKLEKQIVKHVTKASSLIFHDIDNISGEDRSALLVILGLLLAGTYQASLSPPGGVWQCGNSSKKLGRSVMDPSEFLLFFIPTYIVFIVTFFLTLAMLKPFPSGFRTAIQVLLAFLAVCFDQSISFITPTSLALAVHIFSTIVFMLMVFMCITYQVSKFSVSIVGCWMLPFYFSGGDVIQVLLLHFLYDEFWKGTILVVGYSLLFTVYAIVDAHGHDDDQNPINIIMYPIVLIGWWLFFHLCRFCMKQRTSGL
ncbi:putative Ankyrin repeat protein [Hibiscus syriacus]|uniref:Ankyrin repeat protein n=1 Tax=Hibiscus syriacus TaxID=106335 RepID=A0A6A2XQQ9_HIBSY|nr:ankyrin repeat-containing protein BDA1-like [Hibiscus syriacus]KAE8669235.1 putative Ankyrin repeat protein [Hibiscus syriacus]